MNGMARATVELPSLLRDVLHKDVLSVEGQTLEDALEDAYAQLPGLRVHVCDETGKLRQHVLCFLNDDNTPDSIPRSSRSTTATPSRSCRRCRAAGRAVLLRSHAR